MICNDPGEFADEQLAGFASLHTDLLSPVPGGVVAHRTTQPAVAVVIGGGSGHYPAFAGLVGPGFAAGAVVGNIFTSPSAVQVYSVARAADQGRGVVLTFGNYAGDVMNFDIAARRLRQEGIDTRIVLVTDDVASAADRDRRRGIAGDFVVFKAMGAAAAGGADLDEVERIGRSANDATRSFGVAFSGCTLPGSAEPLFTVPTGHMGVGLGIHGEPGIRDEALVPAAELARLLVDGILADRPRPGPSRVAVVLNGLGATKYEELFLLWHDILPLLQEADLAPVRPEVGELVTSLDMGGCSLTLQWLDDELESAWDADAYTPGYRRTAGALAGLQPGSGWAADEVDDSMPVASAAARAVAPRVVRGLQCMQEVLHEHADELGRIDAVAGDGDHGRGMVRGIDAAVDVVVQIDDAGPGWLLRTAGRAWAASAGGTSGVLWGAGLEAAGSAVGDGRGEYEPGTAVDAVDAFTAAITGLGGAQVGDKTLVDALIPFRDQLAAAVVDGTDFPTALRRGADAALIAAAKTAGLTPRLGRARPLAERSVGTPDAGATSLALVLDNLAKDVATFNREDLP